MDTRRPPRGTATPSPPPFFGDDDLDLDAFRALCDRTVRLGDYPAADAVRENVLVYRGDDVRAALEQPERQAELRAEWCRVLRDGPGVLAIGGAYADTEAVDRSSAVFREIVAEEAAAGGGRGDHFGNNERIWNSLQKVGLRAPDAFVSYYGNPVLALVAEAWLGPGYQMTAQMNTVKPGSSPQSPHRDYHLGFQAAETVARFPAHVQVASQYLTLQGAVAHSDMPLESGPTRLLPFSQLYPAGYLAASRPEFVALFDERCVQLPLAKGDAVFFSPALFHGAGANRSEGDRVANLLQISSAFGRPMESVDRDALLLAVYPVVAEQRKSGSSSEREAAAALAAAADGYAFPTNLDSDPPVGGNAPQTSLAMALQALDEGWSTERLQETLAAYAERRRA